jgi:hypothetical protein
MAGLLKLSTEQPYIYLRRTHWQTKTKRKNRATSLSILRIRSIHRDHPDHQNRQAGRLDDALVGTLS